MTVNIAASQVKNLDKEDIVLANGVRGNRINIQSRTPAHWAEIVSGTAGGDVTLAGQVFLPNSNGPKVPVVILAPGSTGINRSHLRHANTLTSAGIGACVIDSFGPRGIDYTYHDQRQLTFSAGTYDVLAAARVLMDMEFVDPERLGAMGPSRGGSATLQAAMRPLADAVLGAGRSLRAVLPMYPSGIFQFHTPRTGSTVIRIAMGNDDRWTHLSAVQGYANAIRLCGGNVSLKVWDGAHHSFDRPDVPLVFVQNGMESTRAPVYYLSDRGYFCDFSGDNEDTMLTESHLRGIVHERYGTKGSWLGSKPGQPESFTQELERFFTETLLNTD